MEKKLNLGCGPERIEGWINSDFDDRLQPDVVLDASDLSGITTDSVDKIYASHLLEHFDYREPILEEWHRVLKPGGEIIIIVPDIVGTWYMMKAGQRWGVGPEGPLGYPIDLGYLNATIFGAHILHEGVRVWWEKNHTHKQVFFFDMLVERMRPLFPDAIQIAECTDPIRRTAPGETMVIGHKAS